MDKMVAYLTTLTGKTIDVLFARAAPLVVLDLRADGTYTISHWAVDDVAQPSDADLAAALAAPVVPVVPASISRWQFFQQLAVQGIITNAEALAAMAGAIPSELATLIGALPSGQQFPAQMRVLGATQFDRADTFTEAIGQAYGMTSAQIDALWVAANAL